MTTPHKQRQQRRLAETDLLGSIFLIFGQLILAVFGSVFTIVVALTIDRCSAASRCNYPVLTVAQYLPAVGGAVVVVCSVAILALRQRQRRSSWRPLALGVAIVIALIPVAVVTVAMESR
jgi:uncharacterized BrkB/YihY/UPF0761 family membrane protein